MVLAIVVRHKTQVEQTEQVSQLIHRIAFGFPECGISAQKVTTDKILKHNGKRSLIGHPQFLFELLAGHPLRVFCDDFHHLTIKLCVIEQRPEQETVYHPQRSIGGKKQVIDVLVKGQLWLQHFKVEGYAAHNHIRFKHLVTVPTNAIGTKVRLCLAQSEGSQIDGMRHATIQTAFVANQLFEHPCGGRAANEQFQSPPR